MASLVDCYVQGNAAGCQNVEMELRRVTANDWRAARDVRLRSLTQDPNVFCSTLERESSFEDQAWLERLGHGITVLAWNGSIPVATVTGKDDPHEAGGREIVAMWVDPTQRGTGLADALIAAIIEWAVDEGAQDLALWVAEGNGHARALYERCGFTATGERDVMPSGEQEIRMRRQLSGASS